MVAVTTLDRLAVDDLYNRYLWALDGGDTDGWMATFTRDAEVLEDQPDGTTWRGAGPAGLREFIEKYHRDPGFPGHQHRETTRMVMPGTDVAADRISFRSYVFAIASHPGEPSRLYWSGYYRDVVERVQGEWLFASRWIAPWRGAVTRSGLTTRSEPEGELP